MKLYLKKLESYPDFWIRTPYLFEDNRDMFCMYSRILSYNSWTYVDYNKKWLIEL